MFTHLVIFFFFSNAIYQMETKRDVPGSGAVNAIQTTGKCSENGKTEHYHLYTQKALLLW